MAVRPHLFPISPMVSNVWELVEVVAQTSLPTCEPFGTPHTVGQFVQLLCPYLATSRASVGTVLCALLLGEHHQPMRCLLL